MSVSIALSSEVLSVFPEAQIGFVVASGLGNQEVWSDAEAAIEALEGDLEAGRWQPFDESAPQIESWHDAYRRFGTNPRRFRPSLDALSRRLRKGGSLPRISGAVNAYNYVSVKYGLPAGAFDAGRISGEVNIRFARSGDMFTPLGEPDETESPAQGEVVYAAGSQVLTRHWNYRDCDQTKVSNGSQTVVFILERVSSAAVSSDTLAQAQKELASLVQPHALTVSFAAISQDSPVATLLTGGED
jgi:DNA/RNA-binding domain of Phe-tRNA-synthetase-like protein